MAYFLLLHLRRRQCSMLCRRLTSSLRCL